MSRLMTLLQQSTPQPVIDRIRKGYEGRNPAAVERARTQYAILERSLARLAKGNAKIYVKGVEVDRAALRPALTRVSTNE